MPGVRGERGRSRRSTSLALARNVLRAEMQPPESARGEPFPSQQRSQEQRSQPGGVLQHMDLGQSTSGTVAKDRGQIPCVSDHDLPFVDQAVFRLTGHQHHSAFEHFGRTRESTAPIAANSTAGPKPRKRLPKDLSSGRRADGYAAFRQSRLGASDHRCRHPVPDWGWWGLAAAAAGLLVMMTKWWPGAAMILGVSGSGPRRGHRHLSGAMGRRRSGDGTKSGADISLDRHRYLIAKVQQGRPYWRSRTLVPQGLWENHIRASRLRRYRMGAPRHLPPEGGDLLRPWACAFA